MCGHNTVTTPLDFMPYSQWMRTLYSDQKVLSSSAKKATFAFSTRRIPSVSLDKRNLHFKRMFCSLASAPLGQNGRQFPSATSAVLCCAYSAVPQSRDSPSIRISLTDVKNVNVISKSNTSDGAWHTDCGWSMKDQLDVTCYFISLLMCSTCFGH